MRRKDESESNAKMCNASDLGAAASIVGESPRNGMRMVGGGWILGGAERKRLPEAGKTNKRMLWKEENTNT